MGIRIGIDLGGTKIEGIALDGSVELVRLRVETPRHDYAATLDAIAGMVTRLEVAAGGASVHPRTFAPSDAPSHHRTPAPSHGGQASVGVGIPGSLDAGRVKNANSVWLIGESLQGDLESRLGRPVRVANDANCFALSEATDGAGAGVEVVFGVIVGTGTGGGIVVGGHLLTGPNAVAGEWGHNPLPWAEGDEIPGPPCYCGQRGCIETFLSGPGLAADHERHTGEHVRGPHIVERALVGDPEAARTLDRYEHRMARALAGVINLLDPDVIVLGGGLSNIERLYVNVPRLWGRYVFACATSLHSSSHPDPRSLTPDPDVMSVVKNRLVRARHGDASGVRGAAWLWP